MLLRSVLITDPGSSHHGTRRDVRVSNGVIDAIAERLDATEDEETVEYEHARLSPGFVDIGAYLGDPGHEEREDVESLTAAATAGGYVAVAVLPEADPVRQSVADLTYLTRHIGIRAVDLLPLAALSRDLKGKDLTEFMELARNGAVGFTDGPHHPTPPGLLKRALEYRLSFPEDGGNLVFDSPHHGGLAAEGQMHEGEVSVRLGLRGIPTIAETIPVQTKLSLLEYTRSSLVLHPLSSQKGLELVSGFTSAYATVSAHHLTFTDEDLSGFDPNFKMLPPLRAERDREALREGLVTGNFAAIVSNHRACHREEKDMEFSYAAFGALGLQTTLRQLLPWIDEDNKKLDATITALTSGPRRLLGLPAVHVEEGKPAQLTLFSTVGNNTFTQTEIKSKATNSPLLGRELPGRILATINNGRLWTSAS